MNTYHATDVHYIDVLNLMLICLNHILVSNNTYLRSHIIKTTGKIFHSSELIPIFTAIYPSSLSLTTAIIRSQVPYFTNNPVVYNLGKGGPCQSTRITRSNRQFIFFLNALKAVIQYSRFIRRGVLDNYNIHFFCRG